jgi:hypothetical protein
MFGILTTIETVNILVALLTIGLGLVGWLAPRWTMDQLDMRAGPSNMAYTEVSAASGGLFVGIGFGALLMAEPLAFTIMGFAYAGAAVGRITSIFRDKAGSRQSWSFFGCEAIFATWLVFANLPI